jgi:hypothetical protein
MTTPAKIHQFDQALAGSDDELTTRIAVYRAMARFRGERVAMRTMSKELTGHHSPETVAALAVLAIRRVAQCQPATDHNGEALYMTPEGTVRFVAPTLDPVPDDWRRMCVREVGT